MNTPSANLMRKIAKNVENEIPKGFGFALFVFPFERPGIANYISNATRETMIEAIEEKVKILKNKDDFKTPEAN